MRFDKGVHIIAFDIPYPANYGGVIDVYYKIKALHEASINVYLHCFQYGNRKPSEELKKITQQVYYYPRITGIRSNFSVLPYIVYSRRSKKLLQNLVKDDLPILFEGLHDTYFMNHPKLKNRDKYIRMHNVEWKYYQILTESENNRFKKCYFRIESMRLRWYENRIPKNIKLLTISDVDDFHYQEKGYDTQLIYPFHAEKMLRAKVGRGAYVLFHGNLAVQENESAAIEIMNQVRRSGFKLIIAGKQPSEKLKALAHRYAIELVKNPTDAELNRLILNAHVNIVYHISDILTGFKLKLMKVLYLGRFCVMNKPLLGSDYPDDIGVYVTRNLTQQVEILLQQNFNEELLENRKRYLRTKNSGL